MSNEVYTINRGSQWRRWEPHIHCPGTVLNDQFDGEDPWQDFIATLEGLVPAIEAIAITDYYVTDSYEEVLRLKADGRFPKLQLIFPNIELRLDVAARDGFVNIHLLVCPDDSDHIAQLKRILNRLQFAAYGDSFSCTRDDLIRLGKLADPDIADEKAALRHGATQFKVSFKQLREVYQASEWAKKNILIAVAGGASDGTSGVRQAADATVRQEIEAFAHIIFAGSPAQREFWIGQRSATVQELQDRYNGCKPCIQGSDSHCLDDVGQPSQDRFSWIKGGLEFDSLRQACIDPEGRAFVGPEPPGSTMPSQVVSDVLIENASWIQTPEIQLNSNLVAIIGARGSGKTALVDIIAAACDSIAEGAWAANEHNSASFLARARPLLGSATVNLSWEGGDEVQRFLDGRDANDHLSFPRARYLSQQFVEELCSANNVTDGLIEEIERVIFESHPIDEREGAISFKEFREYRTERFQQAREREVEAIAEISERIAKELEKESMVTALEKQVEQKNAQIKNFNADLSKIVLKGSEDKVKRHAQIAEAAQELRNKKQILTDQKRTFVAMQDEVASTRATKAPEFLRQARERHSKSGLNDAQWEEFLLIYKGDVDESLSSYVKLADREIAELTGEPVQFDDPEKPLIPDDVDLKTLNLATIVAEMARLESQISADKAIREQYGVLTKRIREETASLKTLEEKLTDAKGAAARRKALQAERDGAYERVFDAIINEQTVLEKLYDPLMERISDAAGTLGKLSFSVKRIVDVERWASFAEENLLDRRKAGSFYGRGALTARSEDILKPAWEAGKSAEVSTALKDFLSEYLTELLSHAPSAIAKQEGYKAWLKQFAHWLFGTDHISVRYEMMYDGIDIRKLSPGTRGIVLLLLYLALDESDERPLIIDQPEESLDPKSVFEELVPLFVDAKSRRQVIIVTHNANLVINTDADQIIVAEAGPHKAGELPPITYRAGGIENASIRKAVCDILEGGEEAFRERARRLRVRLER